MKTAAIVIDSWKLEIYKKVLTEYGFVYTVVNGIGEGTMLLRVEYTFVRDLQPVVEKANLECAKFNAKKLN